MPTNVKTLFLGYPPEIHVHGEEPAHAPRPHYIHGVSNWYDHGTYESVIPEHALAVSNLDSLMEFDCSRR